MARVKKPLGFGPRSWSIGSIVGVALGIVGIAVIGGDLVGTVSVVLVILGLVALLMAVGSYLADPEPAATE